MNMIQRKYLLKERLTPLRKELNKAIGYNAYKFTPYVSWGDLVRMIKSGELKLVKGHYYKHVSRSYLSTSYDNPFGEEAAAFLSKPGGVEIDATIKARDTVEWDQRFKHSTDFLMLASEDTIIALLHNLEKSVKEFITRAALVKEKAYTEQAEYIKWLEKGGYGHNYTQEVK